MDPARVAQVRIQSIHAGFDLRRGLTEGRRVCPRLHHVTASNGRSTFESGTEDVLVEEVGRTPR
jgi:hypothetical protein